MAKKKYQKQEEYENDYTTTTKAIRFSQMLLMAWIS